MQSYRQEQFNRRLNILAGSILALALVAVMLWFWSLVFAN